MYLLVTHIPIFTDGPRAYLHNGWLRDVLLARDWLAPPFGQLTLLAPWRPAEGASGQLDQVDAASGIDVVPVFDDRCRTTQFWRTERKRWLGTVSQYLPRADVLHASMDDMYRPMSQLAFAAACRGGVATVFVGPDMDLHAMWEDEMRRQPWRKRVRMRLYLAAFDSALRRHLPRADLALLKEGAIYERYARLAAHPRAFCHTMYSAEHVISPSALDQRIAGLRTSRPLRLVYCGRLVRRKGVHVSLELLMHAQKQGVAVQFDIIGGGPEEATLRQCVSDLRLGDAVRFLGQLPYGPELIQRLSGYDALLFTPLMEDTPRMLYDGYAAGLPVLATAIPFVRHRADCDGAAVTFAVGDAEGGAAALVLLDRDRSALGEMMRRARAAGLNHAIENWYRRRAEWTVEAVERSRRRRNTRSLRPA